MLIFRLTVARLTEVQLAGRILSQRKHAKTTQAQRSASASVAAKARWAKWRMRKAWEQDFAHKVDTTVDSEATDKS